MRIKRTNLFKKNFRNIVLYIAKDKKIAAKYFKDNLNNSIENLINSPYKFRQSDYYNDENIRDMVFNGYTIIYKIDKIENLITILEIFNKNLPQLEE